MWKKKWKQYGAMIAAAVFLTAAGLSYGLSRKPEETVQLETLIELRNETREDGTGEKEDTTENVASDGVVKSLGDTETTVQKVIYVHVCGEVVKPGVYELPEESRVVDAVTAAGGLSDEAAEEAVNLAEILSDGMQIVIPSDAEAVAAAMQQAEQERGMVNLNTATKEQLMELPGIGEAKAADIVRYREETGGFRTIEEIMQVPGIKDAGFQKIKGRIKV